MFIYPDIDPIALSVGPIKIHWYGLMYLVGFAIAWLLGYWRIKHYKLDWTIEQLSDVIFYSAFGVILGGRIGYMVFYATPELIHHPLSLFRIWDGGMSFHGGLVGVMLALYLFGKRLGKSFLEMTDLVTPLVPLALGAGRIGNFINGELWGRVTDVPWAVVFRHVDDQPRHPSQLYEFGLEGIALFLLVWCYAAKPRKTGMVSAVFLLGYATCRLVAECFREPDSQLGYLAFGWLTMGQLLSIPIFLLGLWIWWTRR